ncbi:MAG: tRNA threonylcarbamoyladenosine dehydratase [Treponema sp.]|nr:tRNA threonylcarbamoyladenosine dehydratase [Treponema sp.]
METQFSRTELLLGKEQVEKLQKSRVLVFGCGGVGGYTVEALARSGVGFLEIVDADVVSLSNLNRQIIALHSTIGKAKVQVLKERILDINPNCNVVTRQLFFLKENADQFDFSLYDYIVDAVDTVSAKIEIITRAKEKAVPVISCMGAGNRIDASFQVTDIFKTFNCPLSRSVRQQLKKRGISNLKVLYSPKKPDIRTSDFPGSVSYVPGVAGLLLAGEVIQDLLNATSKGSTD